MTDHIDVVYTLNDTEVLWSTWSGTIYDENQRGQWHD